MIRTGRPIRDLSPLERQVIEKLDAGRTPREVATELGVANATVRVLLSRAVKKLGSTEPPDRPTEPPDRPKSPAGMALRGCPTGSPGQRGHRRSLGPFRGRLQVCLAAFNSQVLQKIAIVMRTSEAEACAPNTQRI
jgi:DNA-binding NarL/FixJ family response regulator